MPDTDYLRSLVAETTGLMREILLDQGKQVAELKISVNDIRDLVRRLDKFEDWKESIDERLEELCTKQAVDEYSRKISNRDEGRAYVERRSNLEKIITIATQLAGVVALILYLIGS